MSKPRLLNPYLYTFPIFNLWISIVYYRLCRDSVYLAANYIATIDSSGDHWSVYNRSQWWKRNDKPEIAVSHRQNPPLPPPPKEERYLSYTTSDQIIVTSWFTKVSCELCVSTLLKNIYKHGHILYCQYILFSFITYFLGFHVIQ